MKYTRAQLIRAEIRDLISDIRAAKRDDLPEYWLFCRKELRRLLKHRNK